MYMVIPIELTSSNTTTNVTDTYDQKYSYSAWSSSTAYSELDYASYNGIVYQAVTDISSGVTINPYQGSLKTVPTWVEVDYTNENRMFQNGSDSVSTTNGDMTITVTGVSGVDTVAFLGVTASTIDVVINNGTTDVYSATRSLTDSDVSDWWDWYFSDYEFDTDVILFNLPTHPGATFTFTISYGGEDVSCGRILLGSSQKLGDVEFGSTVGSKSYTNRTRNEFGNLTSLVVRRVIKIVNYKFMLDTDTIQTVQRYLNTATSTPTLFFADESDEALINFGLAEDFTIPYDSPSTSTATVEVKSL